MPESVKRSPPGAGLTDSCIDMCSISIRFLGAAATEHGIYVGADRLYLFPCSIPMGAYPLMCPANSRAGAWELGLEDSLRVNVPELGLQDSFSVNVTVSRRRDDATSLPPSLPS